MTAAFWQSRRIAESTFGSSSTIKSEDIEAPSADSSRMRGSDARPVPCKLLPRCERRSLQLVRGVGRFLRPSSAPADTICAVGPMYNVRASRSNCDVARAIRAGGARPNRMRRLPSFLRLSLVSAALCAALGISPAHAAAGKETVCTITVNSSDEKRAFERYLPKSRFEFVELVERGRPDWLESARRKGIRCDILVISGHYDGGDYAGGNEFFSEHVESREYLPVDEMERVACSHPDDGLFAHLKAVYLFGCNTLNPVALRSAPEEIARTLLQSGHAPADAERLARAMSPRFADSSRDRMRHIFRNVPAIYGFSSVAPLGPLAATYLDRYFQSGGAHEVAMGKPSAKLLAYFPGHSLTLTRGSIDSDPDAAFRRDVCQFLDDRISPVQRAQFVHALLRRDMVEVRLFLDRLERYAASVANRPDR